MKRGPLTVREVRALADFRYQLRRFLNGSEEAARKANLKPQQYLLLLAIRGLPPDHEPTVSVLAERMQLRHHSVVELINRLQKRNLLRRERNPNDRRSVIVRLTPRGEHVLARLATQRIAELRLAAPALVRTLREIIQVVPCAQAVTLGARRLATRKSKRG